MPIMGSDVVVGERWSIRLDSKKPPVATEFAVFSKMLGHAEGDLVKTAVRPPADDPFGGLLTLRNWSGRPDSNRRPPVPQTGALPDCATPREPRV
jgi:hypothetical protein